MKLIGAVLLAPALSLGLAAPVAAGPYEDARATYERGDYQMARDLLDNERTREQLDRMCAEAREMRRHA